MNSLTFYQLLLAILLFKSPFLKSKNTTVSSRFLDSVLQDYAFKTFSQHRPKTGIIYDGNVAPEFTGITVSALRLRSGGLRRKGYYGYKEFDIPAGVLENPYVARVVLVYHNLGNWSEVYYPLPGYLFLSPVVGLLAYNASHMTAEMLPELDLRASENPIMIRFGSLGVLADGVLAKCAFFDLFGGVEFARVVNGSVCLSLKQGHFVVVVEENVPAPAPVKSPEMPIAVGGGRDGGRNGWWVGGLVGGLFLVVAAAVVVGVLVALRRCVRRRRVEKMEYVAEGGVPLAVAAVGNDKMPVAMETRTKPVLENDYVTVS
ncbi:hypothetical protein HanRHA438_Chr11g0506491 [Helianthus annuus]|uniref:Concanavalin A-like lectin/glucanase domain-containing protein n=1 Tax=Helianthus annuus TaxID=4232 RepID=A0A251T969_HELAN|nr:uncharacterized protein LOC110889579 [Helianthus annuus]KAF5782267.1 hypothetical protein HanXRQr2_Chr11g0493831 [Helianthus annuus]KAJ0501767.1 hypothetical protein HanHA300_Chr11g0404871 [Helianthus annuus]KAJ0509674.1 hypothetical protein HanIR_Chr11g0531781 [Helianthus annuus]KAJ0517690.1 hypothetical protein HanHA89_Chr11g0428551 [Helianthus annuus]KAJ0685707.1 hypothetical protein HanLR1_Chr11g0406051 [Helianthus annuus]